VIKSCISTLLIFSIWLIAACASENPQTADQLVASDGKQIFQKYCVLCHGQDGKLALNGAKDLSISSTSIEERINQITNGKGLMTPYKGILTSKEIKAVAQYTTTLNPIWKK